MAKPNV